MGGKRLAIGAFGAFVGVIGACYTPFGIDPRALATDGGEDASNGDGGDGGEIDDAASGDPCTDPQWTFCDDFDRDGDLDAAAARWGTAKGVADMRLVSGQSPPFALGIVTSASSVRLVHPLPIASRARVQMNVRYMTLAASEIFALDFVLGTTFIDGISIDVGSSGALSISTNDSQTSTDLFLVPDAWHRITIDVGPAAIELEVDGRAGSFPGFSAPPNVNGTNLAIGVDRVAPGAPIEIDYDNVAVLIE
jgi:hypothetical protein